MPPLKQSDYKAKINPDSTITSRDVAKLPKPGVGSVPSSLKVKGDWITYLAPKDATSLTRQLYATKISAGKDSEAETVEVFQPGSSGQESDFSLEEKLRRERMRQMSTGVTSYCWASKVPTMMIPLGGALWILQDPLSDSESKQPPHKLVETGHPELPPAAPLLDAKISADGSTVAFVCSNEVYVVPTTTSSSSSGSTPKQITFGARGNDGKTNGIADYLAQEEFDRADGFWLSPKGRWLVYESVDESHIPLYRITHQGQPNGLAPALTQATTPEEMTESTQVSYEEHRYPFAGCQNPRVTLAVVSTITGENKAKPIWFDLTKIFGPDFYLARVEWLAPTSSSKKEGNSPAEDSTKFVVQLLDRRQQKLALLLLDCVSGSVTTLHVETAMEKSWINLNNLFRPLPANKDHTDDTTASKFRFLWGSERDGYRHLYVLEADLLVTNNNNAQEGEEAKVIQRLTGPGEYIVEQIVEIDSENQCLYYMGTSPNRWLEKHLFRVCMKETDATTPVCLTSAIPGQHSVVMSKKQGVLIDTVSNVNVPPTVTVYKMPTPTATSIQQDDNNSNTKMFVLHDASTVDERLTKTFVGDKALQPPTFHTFPSTDGKVTLQAAMYKPDATQYGPGPWPLVVATYGGPHVQYVANTWGLMTADMRTQFLRANGFAVIKVDNRGSDRRGLVFEAPIRYQMGLLEVEDQVAGVEWAISQNIASKECGVAVSGWSYGGYMALKCLTDRPDIFNAAISGAPVTDWTLYDTAYTERYMGLPQENVEGYQKSSALARIKDIEGSLLLCHGLLDENVLFRQSAVLINELVAQQKAYDLVLFASERHGPRRPQDRAFMEERLLAFLQRSLGTSS